MYIELLAQKIVDAIVNDAKTTNTGFVICLELDDCKRLILDTLTTEVIINGVQHE